MTAQPELSARERIDIELLRREAQKQQRTAARKARKLTALDAWTAVERIRTRRRRRA